MLGVGANTALPLDDIKAGSSNNDHHILLCQAGVTCFEPPDNGNQSLCQIHVSCLINDNGKFLWQFCFWPCGAHPAAQIIRCKHCKTLLKDFFGPTVSLLVKFPFDSVDPVKFVILLILVIHPNDQQPVQLLAQKSILTHGGFGQRHEDRFCYWAIGCHISVLFCPQTGMHRLPTAAFPGNHNGIRFVHLIISAVTLEGIVTTIRRDVGRLRFQFHTHHCFFQRG
mmetsp:Transcript_16188/g.37315  ORF Transcript_16188/g.37315 Transcript_16188/m.37315 type:complete len:225 (+) Transcript_16188:384-1058(+)